LHQQIARNIRNDIAAGVLRHGQRLPSSRDLAKEWDVSVFTINEAMDLLGKEGLVVSKARAARTVNAPDQAAQREQRSSTACGDDRWLCREWKVRARTDPCAGDRLANPGQRHLDEIRC
jgi:DNA-binding GntR family transcriptional regulator